MTLRLSESITDAETILRHPDIYKTICDDDSPSIDDICIPEEWRCVVAYDGPNIVPVGCFILHYINSVTMVCHVQILPEHREMSAEIGEAVIQWTRDNTEAEKLIAWIPFDCENVKWFAEKMGFKVEGVSEDSIMKGGELLSQWLMGLKLWQS